jgi:hypothetical protein
MTVIDVRSMTRAPGGMAMLSPTSTMVVPETTMTAFARKDRDVPSNNLPVRT